MTPDPTELRDHWWWRPGWRTGRHLHACHLTLDDATDLHTLVDRYQHALAGHANLDLVPRRWLHLTMRAVGFVDEVTPARLALLRDTLTDLLRVVPPVTVTFARAVVRPEAVYLPAHPAGPLRSLHTLLGDAIHRVLGRVHELPEQAAGFRPHVSIAYVNARGPAEPVRAAVRSVVPSTASLTVTEIPLLTFHRDRRRYEWASRDPVPLAPLPATWDDGDGMGRSR